MANFGTAPKRIFALASGAHDLAAALAVWKDGKLAVTEVRPVPRAPGWMDAVGAEMESRAAKGWTVLVEDRTYSFPSAAAPYSFDAVDGETGKIRIQVALDHYFALESRDSLLFGQGVERFTLRPGEGGIVDFATDDKGRQVYKVDWSRIRAGHKAVLLCVAAATVAEPVSERWISAFLDFSKGGTPKREDPFSAWRAITAGHSLREQESYLKRVAALEEEKHHG